MGLKQELAKVVHNNSWFTEDGHEEVETDDKTSDVVVIREDGDRGFGDLLSNNAKRVWS